MFAKDKIDSVLNLVSILNNVGNIIYINFYKYNFSHAVLFFHSFVIICCLFINILLFEQFFPKHHQSIKLFKNPDFVSPYLGPECLQRLSADDNSHWKEFCFVCLFVCLF